MDKGKQVGSSSSSFMDLFGPKDSSKSSSSSTTLFGSIFGPPGTVPGRGTHGYNSGGAYYGHTQPNHHKDYTNEKNNSRVMNKERSSTYDQNGTIEPWHYNSSIYYGGQELYSPSITQNSVTTPHHHFKKDGEHDLNNESASRGNWWQGSLYY